MRDRLYHHLSEGGSQGFESLRGYFMKYTGHRLDHWTIALDIEMMQWDDLLDSLDRAIEEIYSLKSR